MGGLLPRAAALAVWGLGLVFAAGSAVSGERDAYPGIEDYRLVYDLDLNRLRGDDPDYDVNRAHEETDFSRVGYLLELGVGDAVDEWIWIACDAFTDDAALLGVPTASAGVIFHQAVANMEVASNVPGIRPGRGVAGWIEFWPHNYKKQNSRDVPRARDDRYDHGDHPSDGPYGYGSMQIHWPERMRVLFALNHWREAGPDNMDLGIGNNLIGDTDYTNKANAGQFKTKRLRIFVQ